MEIIKGTKIVLLEFMKLKKFKNFKYLRLHIHSDWNTQKYMDNNHFKWLLDWENQEYIGDENGNTILINGHYIGEYDNYVVWNAEPFDDKGICLNLMITPMRKEWILNSKKEDSFFIQMPNFENKIPKIDFKTNLLFGNGITLEILKNTKYKYDYLGKNIILRSFDKEKIKNFFYKKIKINLELHDEKCKKPNLDLPFVNTFNRNNGECFLSLWKSTFDAYKHNLIKDISNNDFIDYIKSNKMSTKLDNCNFLTTTPEISFEDYNINLINNNILNSKNEFKKNIWQLKKIGIFGENTYEILNYCLEGGLDSKNISLVEKRLENYQSDFESWFAYSSLLKDILVFLLLKFSNEKNVEKEIYRQMMSEYTKEFISALKNEEYMKFFIIFSIMNYDEQNKSFVTLDYIPPDNTIIKKIVDSANKVMTLNYDTFLEKISNRNDIYHLHGRLDKIFDINKKEVININTNNLNDYFIKLLELILMGLSPRSKRSDYFFYDYSYILNNHKTEIKPFKTKKEYDDFIHVQQILTAQTPRKKDGINFDYINLNEESLILELLNFNKFQNEKIVLIGINPLGDLSYLIDLIINYNEIYIGYYSLIDRENLFTTIKNLFDYICNPINSFYFPKLSIVRNRLKNIKFYYFETNELYNSFK